MKKLVATILAVALFTFSLGSPALAVDGDPTAGAGIFSANCIACHAGGGNIVNPNATLSQADLEANDRYSLEAIKTQVTNGGGGMASFSYLGEQSIADVAQYVYETATDGAW